MADPVFKPQKEIARIRVQVRKLEKERDLMLPELGRLAYREFLEGKTGGAALSEACGRVKALDDQLGEMNASIASLQAQAQRMKVGPPPVVPAPSPGAVCPSCGVPAAAGVRFCGNCGTEIKAQAPQPAPAPGAGTACRSCGRPLAPGARFCGECGQAVEAAPAAPAAPAAAATSPVPPPPPPPPAPAGPVSPPVPPPPPQPPAPGASSPPPPLPAPGADEADAGRAGPVKCPSCGAAVEEEGAAFCGECGAKLT